MADVAPRELTTAERELIHWVLPTDRASYREIRETIDRWNVIAAGRRGEGHLILGPVGTVPDHDSPLPTVVAFGVMESTHGNGSISVRERMGDQIDIEIVSSGVPVQRRWSYSEWTPGGPCPQCGANVRNVTMRTASGNSVTLAGCAQDKRLWVHDAASGVCQPIPVTVFNAELMRRSGVRDPKLALQPQRLFDLWDSFPDDVLTVAFISYNAIRSKVRIDDPVQLPVRRRSWFARLFDRRS